MNSPSDPRDVLRLRQILAEGRCCSVALVQLGLERLGQRNDQLLQAVSALCLGVRGGKLCGALTGAACMLNLFDPANANSHLVPELTEWFEATMKADYGGADCQTILAGDPANKVARCPGIVIATWLEAKQLLKQSGHDLDPP